MRIRLVTPPAPVAHYGNRTTASRWAGILRELGHRVEMAERYHGGPADLLVALHARRSADSVTAFHTACPGAPVVLALTGTDLYPDPVSAGVSTTVLDQADRLVVLQPLALEVLPTRLRARTRVIYQSVPWSPPRPRPNDGKFDVALIAHLRPVKDPLLAAAAVRLLPGTSRVRVRHAGAALDPDLGLRAGAETAANPRYHWLGELAPRRVRHLLDTSRLLLLTSRHEGGANVISEALAAGVPVASTAIPGSIGLLGTDYPGYFPVGDPAGLATLLDILEHDRDHRYQTLRQRCRALRPLVDPARERQAWAMLINELASTPR